MRAHGYWQPSDIGIDPADGYSDAQPSPLYDPATGTFVPGNTGVAVDDDGDEVVEQAERLDFGEGLDVTDQGGGTARVDGRVTIAGYPPPSVPQGWVFVSYFGLFIDREGNPL